MSVTVTARKGVFWRRSEKHGIRSQAGPPLHGSDRKARLSHPCPNDSSFLKKRSRTRKQTFAYRFCVPRDKPIHWRYVLQRTAGFEPAININGELNPIEQDLGVSLDPLDCPVQATPGIRFGRASRTAVVSFTRAVGVLQGYSTILWGWIHGKKAANCMKFPSIRSDNAVFHGNPMFSL